MEPLCRDDCQCDGCMYRRTIERLQSHRTVTLAERDAARLYAEELCGLLAEQRLRTENAEASIIGMKLGVEDLWKSIDTLAHVVDGVKKLMAKARENLSGRVSTDSVLDGLMADVDRLTVKPDVEKVLKKTQENKLESN